MRLWLPSNSVLCRVLRAHRQNWTPTCRGVGVEGTPGGRVLGLREHADGSHACRAYSRSSFVKASYRQAASDDVVRQFRYYLVTLNLPDVAVRFRNAVRRTVLSLRQYPLIGPRYRSGNPQ